MNIVSRALASANDTYAGCRWVIEELVSVEAKKTAALAVTCLLLSILALMAIPYTIKQAIDAVVADTRSAALWWLAINCAVGMTATIFGTLHDHFREKAWNRNYYTVSVRLMHKLFRRTLEEIIGEDTEIGAEQIESLKDRVQNILYLFLFELSIVITTIAAANAFMFTLDWVAGCAALSLTIFNLIWFFFFNETIDTKMEPIDKAFRRGHRRMIEKLNFATSVKAAGVEAKIEAEVGEEFKEPLQADLKIWAYWFLKIDVTRRVINAIIPVLIIVYGIIYAQWSAGTISAMATWVFMISREYGFIGHLMRHLTGQVARIKAARLALSETPSFNYDEGKIYERNT